MHVLCAVCLQEQAKGPKLVLRADDEEQLLAVMKAAQELCLPTHSIAEATGKCVKYIC